MLSLQSASGESSPLPTLAVRKNSWGLMGRGSGDAADGAEAAAGSASGSPVKASTAKALLASEGTSPTKEVGPPAAAEAAAEGDPAADEPRPRDLHAEARQLRASDSDVVAAVAELQPRNLDEELTPPRNLDERPPPPANGGVGAGAALANGPQPKDLDAEQP